MQRDDEILSEPEQGGWQDFLQRLAHGVRRVALGHPKIFPLVASRPPEAPWLRPPLRSIDWVETFLNGLVKAGFDDEGYWRSGDLGYLSPEGYLKVTDRLKDVVKSGGEWISSIDLENHIMTVPGVRDAAVIGVPHPQWEERPLALVVRDEDSGVDQDAVLAALAERFATWQLPDEVRFVTEIDRTGVGKVNKRKLRADYADALTSGR